MQKLPHRHKDDDHDDYDDNTHTHTHRRICLTLLPNVHKNFLSFTLCFESSTFCALVVVKVCTRFECVYVCLVVALESFQFFMGHWSNYSNYFLPSSLARLLLASSINFVVCVVCALASLALDQFQVIRCDSLAESSNNNTWQIQFSLLCFCALNLFFFLVFLFQVGLTKTQPARESIMSDARSLACLLVTRLSSGRIAHKQQGSCCSLSLSLFPSFARLLSSKLWPLCNYIADLNKLNSN